MTNQAAAAPVPGPRAREPETAARSSANMAVGTLASRILGFLKGIVLGVAVGGSQVAGVFESANTMPNVIYLLVAGGVFNAVLIPQIIKASKAPDRGADFISRLLTLAVLFLLAVTVLLTVAVLPVMMVTTDFSGSKLALVTAFATLLLPQIFFYGLYSLLGQVLNAHGSFKAYAWAPVVNNVVAIAGLGTFIALMGSNAANPHSIDNWTPAQTLLLAGTATLGIVLQSVALLWPLKKLGLGLRPRWGLRGVGLRATGHIAAWTTGTMVVGNLTFLLIGRIATIPVEALDNGVLAKGTIIAGPYELGRATELYILPHSVIALSIATVLFTRISRAAAAKDDDGVRTFLSQGLRTTGVATVFGAVVLLVLSGPFGMLFSGSSRQTAVNIAITLAILAIGSPFLSANFMMTRVFYAGENAKTPFIIQSLLIVFGVGTALLAGTLPVAYIIFGLAGSYTLGNILAVVLTHVFLRRKIGDYGAPRIVRAHLRFIAAAAAAGLVGAGILWLFGGFALSGFSWQSRYSALLVIVVAGPCMAAAYLGVLKLCKVSELEDLMQPLLGRFRSKPASQPPQGR